MNLLKHFTYPAAAALLQDSGRICADTIRHFRHRLYLAQRTAQTTGIGSYYLQNKKSPQGCTRGIYKSKTCRSERIDSICQLLAEKEKLLNRIMLVLYEQEEIKEKIARQVPAIARKSTREKPQKRKRTGFLGLFGKKEEAKPTATTTTFRFFSKVYGETNRNISTGKN